MAAPPRRGGAPNPRRASPRGAPAPQVGRSPSGPGSHDRAVNCLEADLVLDASALLAESPCWDSRCAELLWVDIDRGSAHGWHPKTGSRWSADCGKAATFIIPRTSGGYIVGLELGIGVLDRGATMPKLVCPLVASGSGLRMNDGCCDLDGHLWAGTASTSGARRTAALLRIDPDWRISEVLGHVTTSNGIAWTADGTMMYYVDSGEARVRKFVAGEWMTFAEIDPERGRPDGLTVDSEGGVWVALWGGGRVQRYCSDGTLDFQVVVDAPLVTNCCFGGTNLDMLFVTTAMDADRRGGGIYAMRPGMRGLPAVPFAR
jgi:sugar lactone lactonase YvrE